MTADLTIGIARVIVMDIDEIGDSTETLSRSQSDEIEAIANLKRRRERSATYHIINRIFPQKPLLRHEADRSPVLVNENGIPMETEISISHSARSVAVAAACRRIGVDIECMSSKIDRVASKFLSEAESRFIDTSAKRLVAWTVKEAVYKAAATEGLPLVNGIEISPEGFMSDSAATVYVSHRHKTKTSQQKFAATSIVNDCGEVLTLAYSLTP